MFMIIALGTYIYFENNYMPRHRDSSNLATSTLASITPHQDIYPLYPELVWRDTETIITKIEDLTFQNFHITSQPLKNVKDIQPIAASFHKYYDDKLKVMGWGEGESENKVSTNSQWTYKKGSKYIILSYAQNEFSIITGGHE